MFDKRKKKSSDTTYLEVKYLIKRGKKNKKKKVQTQLRLFSPLYPPPPTPVSLAAHAQTANSAAPRQLGSSFSEFEVTVASALKKEETCLSG